MDKALAKRGIKILNTGIAIQCLASCKNAKELDILYLIKEEGDTTLERIIKCMKGNTEANAKGEEYT